MNFLTRLRAFVRNRSGVAMVEFAMGAPLLLTAGLWGAEEANYALVNMKVSQLAEHIADNASRVGDTSTLQNRKIYESDINDVIYGAQVQGGKLNLYDNGRVVISSVEVDGTSSNQYIHWQRCRGLKNYDSAYGGEGDDLGTSGIGPAGEQVTAEPGDAVIFVEVNYTYQPLVSAKFLGSLDIYSIASFTVRDNRDLTQIYQREAGSPDPVQNCSAHTGDAKIGTDGSFD
jgi:Flp pilus assembly protein TadG